MSSFSDYHFDQETEALMLKVAAKVESIASREKEKKKKEKKNINIINPPPLLSVPSHSSSYTSSFFTNSSSLHSSSSLNLAIQSLMSDPDKIRLLLQAVLKYRKARDHEKLINKRIRDKLFLSLTLLSTLKEEINNKNVFDEINLLLNSSLTLLNSPFPVNNLEKEKEKIEEEEEEEISNKEISVRASLKDIQQKAVGELFRKSIRNYQEVNNSDIETPYCPTPSSNIRIERFTSVINSTELNSPFYDSNTNMSSIPQLSSPLPPTPIFSPTQCHTPTNNGSTSQIELFEETIIQSKENVEDLSKDQKKCEIIRQDVPLFEHFLVVGIPEQNLKEYLINFHEKNDQYSATSSSSSSSISSQFSRQVVGFNSEATISSRLKKTFSSFFTSNNSNISSTSSLHTQPISSSTNPNLIDLSVGLQHPILPNNSSNQVPLTSQKEFNEFFSNFIDDEEFNDFEKEKLDDKKKNVLDSSENLLSPSILYHYPSYGPPPPLEVTSFIQPCGVPLSLFTKDKKKKGI